MKRILVILTILALLMSFSVTCAENASLVTPWTTRLTARFATVEEGKQLMRTRMLFHEQISETMLPFFLQKKGGSFERRFEQIRKLI